MCVCVRARAGVCFVVVVVLCVCVCVWGGGGGGGVIKCNKFICFVGHKSGSSVLFIAYFISIVTHQYWCILQY